LAKALGGTLAVLLLAASSVSAHPVTHLAYDGSINGSDAVGVTSPSFVTSFSPYEEGLSQLAMDQATRSLYVDSEQGEGRVYKFNAATRQSEAFSALAPKTVITPQSIGGIGGLAVDNTDSAEQGRIYALPPFGPVSAYAQSGAALLFSTTGINGFMCGATVGPEGHLWIAFYEEGIKEFLPSGVATGTVVPLGLSQSCNFAMDSEGNFYAPTGIEGGQLKKYDSTGAFLYNVGAYTSGYRAFTVNRSDDSVYLLEGGLFARYASNGSPIDEFGEAEPGYGGLTSASGIVVDESTNEVYVSNYTQGKVDIFKPGPPSIGADATTGATIPRPTSATLHGTVNPDGVDTTDCYFEWGVSTGYGHKADCADGDVFIGSSDQEVTAEILPGEIALGETYHVRLVVENSSAGVVFGGDRAFIAQDKPVIKKLYVNGLNTDGARLNAEIDPSKGSTKYRFEYGTDTSYGTSVPVPDGSLASRINVGTVKRQINNLTPGTEYDYRIVATNAAGEIEETNTFSTFPKNLVESGCENQLSRQQTGAALLPDCRAYELASAANTGGYNVESDLVPGEEPFDGYPGTDGRLLYGVHDGGITGTGNPTNHGVDPYLATRGEDGWSTKYVGVPANGTPSSAPFSSPLLGSDEGLNVFAFGGPSICDPCFGDGSSGIPFRDSKGALSQGMAGDLEPNPPATGDGLIRKSLSADGTHLIFGSTSAFESDGNDETGDVSIYDRDLSSPATQVVSKTPAGTNLPCLQGAGACHSPGDKDGIAELDISKDGSRIIVAQKVTTDSAANNYWHPYMHIGTSPNTVDLAPGTTSGVLFDGMTEDGSKVFFTTKDKLSGQDTDESADIYLDEVSGAGPVTPQLISVNGSGPSNSDGCHPLDNWNTVQGGPNCDVVAFAGGAGLASEEGSFYFISPELLDGSSGEEDLVNLYLVKPGQAPHFVAVMDSGVGKTTPPPSRPVVDTEFISGLNSPEALAVDQSNGDVYVAEFGDQTVSRFKANGEPHNFTAGPDAGTNEMTGLSLGFSGPTQIAVDNHGGSPLEGAIYVTDSGDVSVFSSNGKKLGSISGYACGVTVDQSTGAVYLGTYSNGIYRLDPTSNTTPVSKANYDVTQIGTLLTNPCLVGADSAGHVFGLNYQNGPLRSYPASLFASSPPLLEGTVVSAFANGFALDPSTNELMISMGEHIDVYSPFGDLKEEIAKGAITNSHGIAVNGANQHVYALNESQVVEIGYVAVPFKPIDNPAVRHAVQRAGVQDSGDFQVSPSGHFAAFGSATPITGFDSFGHLEIYRYDAGAGLLDCASCAPTNAQATKDASLPAQGNGLASDGRVFFNSSEPLVLRDTNGNGDPYEWKDDKVYLLSSGTSPFDSSLLSVSADGTDAYFFTREKLAPGDQNGSLVRVYDAREGGGFFHIPDPPPCAASDECHGPGSQAPVPPGIGSLGATAGNVSASGRPSCKRGFARKGRKCVKRHKRRPSRLQRRGAGR
jgi:hypothetical protein